MKILSIIPAKENSIRLAKKNLRELLGKSLLEYTIDTSLRSSLINRTIVSTDSKKISKLAISLGAEAPFLRPKKLVSPSSTNFDVIKHVLNFLQKAESYTPDIIILLQPTSPLRTTKMIDQSIKILRRSNATSVVSVKTVRTNPYASFLRVGKYAKPFSDELLRGKQKCSILYYPTGAIYSFWYNTVKKYDSIYGPKIRLMIHPEEISVDIDIPFDFFMAEMIIRKWPVYKKQFDKRYRFHIPLTD
jgi:CMP-N-acetylneuraminic acid synthetase